MPDSDVVVYAAGGMSPARNVWPRMIADAWSARTLVWHLAVRDFKTQYKQSLLGYATALGPPLLTMAVFTFAARRRLLPIGDTALPYPVFVLLGLTVWGLFSGVVAAVTGSLAGAAALIKKMDFPREAVVFSSLGKPLTDTIIRSIVLAALLVGYGLAPGAGVLLLPLVLLPLVLLALGLGFVLAIFNALARDVATAVGMALQFGMFLTPVVYPPPTSWPLVLINYVNPVSPFVIAAQDLVARGHLTMPAPLLASTLFGVLAFAAGWRVFRLAERIVGERL